MVRHLSRTQEACRRIFAWLNMPQGECRYCRRPVWRARCAKYGGKIISITDLGEDHTECPHRWKVRREVFARQRAEEREEEE